MRALTSFTVTIISFLFYSIVLASTHGGHDGHSMDLKQGRYKGNLIAGERTIPAVLDLFLAQKEDQYPELKAILKLSPGGYGSHEYLGYSFDKIYLDPASKTLSFSAGDQDLLLTQVMVHGSQLMGQYYVRSEGFAGQFNFKHFKAFEEELPPPTHEPPEDDDSDCLPGEPCDPPEEDGHSDGGHGGGHTSHSFQPQVRPYSLAGVYKGSCDGRSRVLQVDTERNREGLERVKSPFGQYRISARLGDVLSQSVHSSKKTQILEVGQYSPFTGALSLSGNPRGLRCELSTSGDKLVCGSCVYQRKQSFSDIMGMSGELISHERSFKIDPSNFSVLASFPSIADVRGTYRGFLHHESTNEYQAAEFNLEAFYFTDKMHAPNMLYMEASIKLSIGASASIPKVVHIFEQRPWMNSDGAMVFEGESEGFGVVRSWRRGYIKMDWYSKNYGRVGTIELVKEGDLSLPESARALPLFTSSYVGPQYRVDLDIISAVSGEDEVFNTSFGIELLGNSGRPAPGISHHIVDSSYDVYTGVVSLHLANGSKLMGILEEEGLKLFLSGVDSIGYPMMDYSFYRYQRSGQTSEEHKH